MCSLALLMIQTGRQARSPFDFQGFRCESGPRKSHRHRECGGAEDYTYLRVSTGSQDLANQKMAVLDYARQKRFTVDRFVEVQASSRKNPAQKGIEELLGTLAAEDRLVVSELSRLGRLLGRPKGALGKSKLDGKEFAVAVRLAYHEGPFSHVGSGPEAPTRTTRTALAWPPFIPISCSGSEAASSVTPARSSRPPPTRGP